MIRIRLLSGKSILSAPTRLQDNQQGPRGLSLLPHPLVRWRRLHPTIRLVVVEPLPVDDETDVVSGGSPQGHHQPHHHQHHQGRLLASMPPLQLPPSGKHGPRSVCSNSNSKKKPRSARSEQRRRAAIRKLQAKRDFLSVSPPPPPQLLRSAFTRPAS